MNEIAEIYFVFIRSTLFGSVRSASVRTLNRTNCMIQTIQNAQAHINTHTHRWISKCFWRIVLLEAFNHVFTWSKISEIGEMNEGKRFTDFEHSRIGIQSLYTVTQCDTGAGYEHLNYERWFVRSYKVFYERTNIQWPLFMNIWFVHEQCSFICL